MNEKLLTLLAFLSLYQLGLSKLSFLDSKNPPSIDPIYCWARARRGTAHVTALKLLCGVVDLQKTARWHQEHTSYAQWVVAS